MFFADWDRVPGDMSPIRGGLECPYWYEVHPDSEANLGRFAPKSGLQLVLWRTFELAVRTCMDIGGRIFEAIRLKRRTSVDLERRKIAPPWTSGRFLLHDNA